MRSLSCAFWPARVGAAQLEQLALAADQPRDVRIVGAREQLGGKVDPVLAVALGLEPRPARRKLVEALGDDREVGPRLASRRGARPRRRP